MTCSGARRSARPVRRAQTKGPAAGGIDRPRPPTLLRDRSVLAFESDAGERGLQKPGVPITGFDHERHCHAAKHGELMDDRPGWGGLGGLGLGRHTSVRVQRGCHGSDRGLRGFFDGTLASATQLDARCSEANDRDRVRPRAGRGSEDSAHGRSRHDCATAPGRSYSEPRESSGDGCGRPPSTPSRRAECNRPTHISQTSCDLLSSRASDFSVRRCKACARV